MLNDCFLTHNTWLSHAGPVWNLIDNLKIAAFRPIKQARTQLRKQWAQNKHARGTASTCHWKFTIENYICDQMIYHTTYKFKGFSFWFCKCSIITPTPEFNVFGVCSWNGIGNLKLPVSGLRKDLRMALWYTEVKYRPLIYYVLLYIRLIKFLLKCI